MRGTSGAQRVSAGCVAPSLAPSTGYFSMRCRCQRCKAWASEYFRNRRLAQLRWKARAQTIAPGDLVAICHHAQAIVRRMMDDGVPDAAAVGIALEHLRELVDRDLAAAAAAPPPRRQRRGAA